LHVTAEGLRESETAEARTMLVLLSCSVAAVLLVASVNVANLLLGQSRARTREFAVRAALGGRAGRLTRQIVTDSLALSAFGGLAGLTLAPALTRAFIALYPGRLPRVEEIAFDWQVAAAGVVITAVAGILAAVPTARRASRIDLTTDLSTGGRGTSRRQGHTGPLLIASQVALSLALLFASGLLVQTLRSLVTIDPGFRTAGITTFQVVTPPARYRTAADIDAYFARVDEALRALPGVADVATSSEMPYNGNSASDVFIMEERGDLKRDNPQARFAMVSPSYWRLLGSPLARGRAFAEDDDRDAPRVAIVNEALAARYYPGQDPVGRRIQFNRETWQIVGVSTSMRMAALATPSQPQLYLPAAQNTRSGRYVLVKAAGEAPPRLGDLRQVMRKIDPTIAMTDVATLDDRTAEARAPERFRAVLFSTLGVIALVLSSLGIYSVLAEAVERQARDIGIRLALGEAQARVRRRVVGSALGAVGIGTVAGLGLAMLAGRSLAGVLVGIDGWHLPTLVATTATLLAVAAAAAYAPAHRASRLDPLQVLRRD
jgi:predicted permease